MKYLSIALYAEGPTDYYFLSPILQRLCEDICMREATEPVEVSPALALDHPETHSNSPREQRILEAARCANGAWQIIFIHGDGSGNSKAARDNLVQPAIDAISASPELEGIGVGVVPIRETEAWAISDGDAIRSAFGTRLNNQELGLPANGRQVERVIDPKSTLDIAFTAAQPNRKRKGQGASPYLNAIAQQISLNELRKVGSFEQLENELTDVLQQLRVIR